MRQDDLMWLPGYLGALCMQLMHREQVVRRKEYTAVCVAWHLEKVATAMKERLGEEAPDGTVGEAAVAPPEPQAAPVPKYRAQVLEQLVGGSNNLEPRREPGSDSAQESLSDREWEQVRKEGGMVIATRRKTPKVPRAIPVSPRQEQWAVHNSTSPFARLAAEAGEAEEAEDEKSEQTGQTGEAERETAGVQGPGRLRAGEKGPPPRARERAPGKGKATRKRDLKGRNSTSHDNNEDFDALLFSGNCEERTSETLAEAPGLRQRGRRKSTASFDEAKPAGRRQTPQQQQAYVRVRLVGAGPHGLKQSDLVDGCLQHGIDEAKSTMIIEDGLNSGIFVALPGGNVAMRMSVEEWRMHGVWVEDMENEGKDEAGKELGRRPGHRLAASIAKMVEVHEAMIDQRRV